MPRLYVSSCDTETVVLSKEQSHYLINVLRLGKQDLVHIFNETLGEWQTTIKKVHKSQISLHVLKQTRIAEKTPYCGLAFAPLKHDAMTFLIEKATELGITHLFPLQTHYSQTRRLPLERLQKNVQKASEQCERLDIPKIFNMQLFSTFLENWPCHQKLFVGLERSNSPLLKEFFLKEPTFLIGPEGGFSPEEIKLFDFYPFIQKISLGKRILKAETASLSCLVLANFY